MIRFGDPVYLLLVFFPFLLVIWRRYSQRHGQRHVCYSSRALIGELGATIRTRLVRVLPAVKIFSLLLFILAMARPQLLNYTEVQKMKGIDIVIALDISSSMASIDYQPNNRLEVAKQVIGDFIRKRSSDRLGLVLFAGEAFTKSPLTVDYGILKYYLSETRIGEIEDGTAIGMALASSVNRLKVSESKTRIVILLTDGVNNRGEIAPLDAARIARDFDIKVYTIGVGKEGKADFPVTDRLGNRRLVPVDVKIDEELLRKIAEETGGLYFRATEQDSLREIFREIDQWEKTEIQSRQLTERKDLYPWLLAAGIFLLMLVEFSRRSILRLLP